MGARPTLVICLWGGFRAPATQQRIVPGEPGDMAEYRRPISIYLGAMRGAVSNVEVYRRATLDDGAVVFKYAGLERPVEGFSLEEVYRP